MFTIGTDFKRITLYVDLHFVNRPVHYVEKQCFALVNLSVSCAATVFRRFCNSVERLPSPPVRTKEFDKR
jgi:hypothetical protein